MEKIPKEQWDKMTQDEKDYLTLEFKKSVEKRQRVTIIVTRILALIFIAGLFYMGYSQLEQAKIYDNKVNQYGVYGLCALCGEYNLKKCECQYAKTYDATNKPIPVNKTKLGEELAEYNAQECKPFQEFIDEKIKDFQKPNLTITLK